MSLMFFNFQPPLRSSFLDNSRPAAAVAPRAAQSSLLELAVCELHAMALNVATVTSFANALASRGRVLRPAEVEPYVPHDLTRLAAVVGLLEDEREEWGSLEETSGFLAAAAGARPAFDAYLEDAASLGAARASVLHWRPMSQDWRSVCSRARLMLAEIETVLGHDLSDIYRDNAGVLRSLLAGAENGLRPCIDEAGQVFLPPLPQRRRWPRKALLQSCRIRSGNREFTAYVRDVSAGGLGLEMLPPVGLGETLLVTLEGGRCLKGVVQWTRAGAAGIAFETLLRPADPLLMG